MAATKDQAQSAGLELEVSGYGSDVLVRGKVLLTAPRLTDMLRISSTVTLRTARATVLVDGRNLWVPEIEILRDELIAMSMEGPRGDPNRHVRRPDRLLLEVRSGPYLIWGRAHVPPAVDPVEFAQRRGLFLPLTAALVVYQVNGREVRDELPGLIVNLQTIDLMTHIEVESIASAFDSRSPGWQVDSGEVEPIAGPQLRD